MFSRVYRNTHPQTRFMFGAIKKHLITALLLFPALFAILTPTTAPAATLSSIAVTPANPTLTVGQTQQFTATGTFSDGTSRVLIGGSGGGAWVVKAMTTPHSFRPALGVVNGILYAVGGTTTSAESLRRWRPTPQRVR